MANTKITELTALTQCAATDVLPIVKVSANTTKKVSISDLLRNAPAGTAGAPGIANADDQDTGILFPAANSIGVSTGGAQRLVIDSSGNCGIGTSSPSTSLDVSGAISLGSVAIPSAGTARIYSRNTDNNLYLQTGSGDTINFLDGSQNTLASFGDTALVFNTGNSERMRIDSSGNVGIGSTTPGSFDSEANNLVVGTGSGDNGITIFTGGASGVFGSIFFADSSVGDAAKRGQIRYEQNNEVMSFYTNASERMRIDSSGKVGIGTTSPGAALSCFHATNNTLATFQSGDSVARATFIDPSGQAHVGAEGDNLVFAVTSSASEAARIDSSGRLLVGTTSARTNVFAAFAPAQQIEGTTADTSRQSITRNSNSAGSEPALIFGKSRGTSNGSNTVVSSGDRLGALEFSGADGTVLRAAASVRAEVDGTPGDADMPGRLLLSTTADGASSPTERMRIDSSGNVGIGTSSPVSDAVLTLSTDSDTALFFRRGASTNQDGAIRFEGGDFQFLNGANSSTVAGLSERMRIDNSGRVLVGTTGSDQDALLTVARTGDGGSSPSTISSATVATFRATGGLSHEAHVSILGGSTGASQLNLGDRDDEDVASIRYDHNNNFMQFNASATERMRIDSSGRLLVGASSSSDNNRVVIQGNTAGGTYQAAVVDLRINGANPPNNYTLGEVNFRDNGGARGALIKSECDGDWASNDYPGRLVFSTTADGASSTTERMRIDSSGNLTLKTTSSAGKFIFQEGSTNAWSIDTNGANGYLRFYDEYNSSERVRIDNSGRVLVGTSSNSGAKLFVAGGSGQSVGTEVDIARFFASTASSINSGGLTIGAVWHNSSVNDRIAYLQSEQGDNPGNTARRLSLNPSGGNVGIGTKSPSQHLQVEGSGSQYIAVTSTDSDNTGVLFGDTDVDSGYVLYANSDNSLRFGANAGERMRITSVGLARISTNTSDSDYYTASDEFHLVHTSYDNRACLVVEHSGNSNPYGIAIDFSDAAPDNNGEYFLRCFDNSTNRLYIYSDGDIDNHDNSYGSISDQKLKQDIVDAGSQWDDLKNLRVRKFKFKSDVAAYGDEAKTLIGLVAQEAETVSPGLVKDKADVDEDGNDLGTVTKSIRYSVLYMKAVKALQEAMDRIETLEAKVAALEAQ